SALPYKVDIIDLNNETQTKLNAFIQKEGIVIFDSQKNTGNDFMSLAALHEKLSDFQSALLRLTEALSVDITKNSLFLDGIIQRFEFTYELSWKLMKAYLRHLGIEANNPRDTFRESLKQGLILEEDAHRWFDMIDKRNLTSHTYHEKNALHVYAAVKNDCILLLQNFEVTMSPLIQGT
ncbi:MAG: nucleotidyltransferase substrate binding protein, partial [Gammaproteobacteria bacterium]|nr:nucleotidyltransferase substrate binding protein [Gammaproteobacteria bacterium]